MDSYAAEVRDRYRSMETEELLERVRNGSLTSTAHDIAISELISRGVSIPQLPQMPVVQQDGMHSSFLVRCWRGEEKLWKAYWGLGLIWVVATIVEWLSHAVLLLVVVLPLWFILCVSVWRCAPNSSHWFWRVLARALVVFGVLGTIGPLVTLFSAH